MPEPEAGQFDLTRYEDTADLGGTARRIQQVQERRKRGYYVNLPLETVAQPFNRPITKVMAYLYLEASFARSATVKASFTRAERLLGLTCCRKTFYRSIDQLEKRGVLSAQRSPGKSIMVTLRTFLNGRGSAT